jgi:hypothetical protein
MQEYAFIPGIGMKPETFWKKCNDAMKANRMDQILAYMYVMLEESKGKLLVTHDTLRALGKEVKLFSGVKTWFKRVNAYAEKIGMQAEHYIISSGLKEIIEGTPIANEFREIYAASFCYDAHDVPCWPAMAVNYTSKTQFLFRINKGVLDVTEHDGLNEFMPEDKRRVPFRNMIYIGDGLTDVPCMKLTRVNGGHSIAVYQDKKDTVNEMILQGRVDFVVKADYSKNSEMEKTVFFVIDQVAATSKTIDLHLSATDQAKKEEYEKQKLMWEREHHLIKTD